MTAPHSRLSVWPPTDRVVHRGVVLSGRQVDDLAEDLADGYCDDPDGWQDAEARHERAVLGPW